MEPPVSEKRTPGRPPLSLAERVRVGRFKAREHAALLDDPAEVKLLAERLRELHTDHPDGLVCEHADRLIGAALCCVYRWHARNDADLRRVALAAEHLIVSNETVPPKATLLPPRPTDLARRNA
jgi:hypothetical protein